MLRFNLDLVVACDGEEQVSFVSCWLSLSVSINLLDEVYLSVLSISIMVVFRNELPQVVFTNASNVIIWHHMRVPDPPNRGFFLCIFSLPFICRLVWLTVVVIEVITMNLFSDLISLHLVILVVRLLLRLSFILSWHLAHGIGLRVFCSFRRLLLLAELNIEVVLRGWQVLKSLSSILADVYIYWQHAPPHVH